MIGGKNPNHRNFYLKEEPLKEPVVVEVKKEVKEEPIKEEVVKEEKSYPTEKDDIYDLTKKEQTQLLEELGVDKKDIKKLKYEKDRVDKILELTESFK